MEKILNKTPQEILEINPPIDLYKGNKFKDWREAWIVAHYCRLQNIDSKISINEKINSAIDVFLSFDNNIRNIQCTESTNRGGSKNPKDINFKEYKNASIHYGPYIKSGYEEKILKNIVHKNNLYSKETYKALELFVYINFAEMIKIDDLNISKIRKRCNNFNFEQIWLLDDLTTIKI